MIRKAPRGLLATLAVVSSVCGITDRATADVCDAVLRYKAFNITESTTSSDVRRASYDALCKSHWTSTKEFSSKSGNFDTHGEYIDIFKGGTHGDANFNQQKFDEDYDRLCTSKQEDVLNRFFSASYIQNTDRAVDAWQNCVVNSHQTGMWSTLYKLEDSGKFSISVYFNPTTVVGTPAPQLVLRGYTEDDGYECKIGDERPFDYNLEGHGIGAKFILSCHLTSDQNASAYILTNYNGEGIGPFKIASQTYTELSNKIDNLQ